MNYPHRNLAFLPGVQLNEEVTESWARVEAETDASVPVFCFPFGVVPDDRALTERILKDAGLIGAVSAEPGYASGSEIKRSPFSLSRFSWPSNMQDLRQVSWGIERAKALFLRRSRP